MSDKSISIGQMWRYIRSDLSRYKVTDQRSYLTIFLMCPGASACVWYRVGFWLWHITGPGRYLASIAKVFYMLGKRWIEITTGISLEQRAQIGYGLYIGHFGGIFVGEEVIMGDNCNLSQGVTLGASGRGAKHGSPRIGDRVYIAAGAKVFGKISIGNDAVIGANAAVAKSLPDCAVAVGNPATVISKNGSFEYIFYVGMENDPARLANLETRPQLDQQTNQVGNAEIMAR